jgi:hypothetical protein
MTITAEVQIVSPQNHDHVIMSYFFPILLLTWGMLLRFSCMHAHRNVSSGQTRPTHAHPTQFGRHMEDQQDDLLRHYIDLFSQIEMAPAVPLLHLQHFALG